MTRPSRVKDKRPPLVRLNALLAENSLERAERRLDMIRDQLDAGADPAPWLAAVATLHESGAMQGDEWIYFLDIFSESLVIRALQTDPELVPLNEKMLRIECEFLPAVPDGVATSQ